MGGEQFIATTGVKQKRVASESVTSSDLCFEAAEKLIAELNWEKAEIDALVFVTQSPDYRTPASSCILQDRLGLPQSCFTLDISLGCSGWVYGLSVIASLMQSGGIRRGLLLAGDTVLKMCSSEDKSTYPLFGDAGTCTAVEFDPEAFQYLFFSRHSEPRAGKNASFYSGEKHGHGCVPERC